MPQTPAHPPSNRAGAPLLPSSASTPAISPRALFLGVFLTLLVSALTVYSDNVLHNTYLVGNHFPLLLITATTFICVVINPILGERRFAAGELAVALALMTIACAMPSSGFWRYFPALLNDTVFFSKDTPWFGKYLDVLPDALLPTKDASAPMTADFFFGRDPYRSASMWATLRVWIPVFLAWSCFLLPMFAATLLVAALFRKQWVVHERLAFPFASIPLEMIADPAPGHRLNAVWRSRALWVAVAIPFAIHLLNGIASFNPTVPLFPLKYDLTNSFTEYPWNTLNGSLRANQVYFLVVGVTFFVPLEISFSLWFFFVASAVKDVAFNRAGVPIIGEHYTYQGLGMFLAYGLLILWIARHHLFTVAKSLRKPREPDEFLSYGLNVALLLGCIILATTFLAWAFGSLLSPANFALGFLLVGLILFYGLVLTRLVIDAGVIMIQVPFSAEVSRCLGFLFTGHTALLTIRHWIVAAFTSQILLTDQRETLMPFAADALRLASATPTRWRPRMFAWLAGALLLAFVISGGMHHWITFTYGRNSFDDGHGPVRFPRLTMELAQENHDPSVAKPKINRPLHVAYGAAGMATIGTLRLVFSSFPLHPIGLLMWNNWAIGRLWFSIFLCWLVKALLLRFGGAPLYNRARYFFLGLIVGEALAGVLWIVVGFVSPWASASLAYQVLPH